MGSQINLILLLGLAPQALCFRLFHRLRPDLLWEFSVNTEERYCDSNDRKFVAVK